MTEHKKAEFWKSVESYYDSAYEKLNFDDNKAKEEVINWLKRLLWTDNSYTELASEAISIMGM